MSLEKEYDVVRTADYAVDQGLRKYMLGVYNYMTAGMLVSALTAFGLEKLGGKSLVMNVETGQLTGLGTLMLWAPLILMLVAAFRQPSLKMAQVTFWAYSLSVGVLLLTVVYAFTGASVVRALFVTAGMFAGMSIVGYTTKKDLTGLGSFLMMGVIGLIIASVVNIFWQSSGFDLLLSVAGLGIFVGLTAFSTQQIKALYYAAPEEMREYLKVQGALSLYINFVNIFMSVMRLSGDRR